MVAQVSEAEIENGIKALIGNASLGLSIVWPNGGSAERPYAEVIFVDSNRQGGALGGANVIETISGVLSVIVVTDTGEHTTTANGYAQSIADLFAEGTKVAITNGQVVMRMPSIKKGYEANKEWRTPVMIPYTASRV